MTGIWGAKWIRTSLFLTVDTVFVFIFCFILFFRPIRWRPEGKDPKAEIRWPAGRVSGTDRWVSMDEDQLMMRKGPLVGHFLHGDQPNCCGRPLTSMHRKMFTVNGDLRRRLNHSIDATFNISVRVMCCTLRLPDTQHNMQMTSQVTG